MEDFNALAAALGAGISDIRGCLILSSDGLVLGASPQDAENDARTARIKIAALGEPLRGFLQFGTEVWCYVRRGPYAALAITGTEVRPGLVLDQMEQALLAAEEARSRREGLRLPEPAPPPPAPASRPRSLFHREPKPAEPVEEPVVIHSRPLAETFSEVLTGHAPERPQAPQELETPDEPESQEEPDTLKPQDDVDRFSLAREFSRLLQDDRNPADG